MDPITNVVTGSEELFRIFGLVQEGATFENFAEIFHPDDREANITLVQRAIESGEGWDIDHRIICHDGTEKWVRAIGEVITDNTGKTVELIGTVQDTTELKQTAQALFESELRMRNIYNSLDEAVLVVTPDRKLVNANKAAIKMFGYSIEEMQNSSTELLHVDHQHFVEFGERINQAFSKGQYTNFEFVAKRKNGEVFPTEHTVSHLKNPDGEIKGIVSVVRDITKRKQTEGELRKEKDSAQNYLDIAGVMLVALNEKGEVILINKKGCAILGYSENEIVGKNWFDHYLPKPLGDKIKGVFSSLMAGEIDSVKFYENHVLTKSGEEKMVAWHNSVLHDKKGRIIGTLSSGEDITERKQAEKELELHRTSLEELVGERTAELKFSLAEKEVLLKEVHHRVKNNMAMVSAFIQLQMGQTDNSSAISALTACDNRIRAMAMVHKKLYQSKDLANIDMQDLYQEISDALYLHTEHGKIEIKIQAHEIYLDMDIAIPCAMIANELLSNSLKYAFEEYKSGKINIAMEKIADEKYHIRFNDDGCGLPDDISVDHTDTLGLQLVNIFIDQLNGSIALDKKDGTTFNIVFPG
jgi:PAS domain S-box-containing protein